MTEKAKAAAFEILREYVDIKGWTVFDVKSAAAHIGNIIDAKFAPVVKERDDYKEALRELVEATREYVDVLTGMEIEDGEVSLGDAIVLVTARERLEAARAAAEKLLEEPCSD